MRWTTDPVKWLRWVEDTAAEATVVDCWMSIWFRDSAGMIWYEEEPSIARGGEEQLDKKLDKKLDMELDVKTSHGCAREEREACARGGRLQAGTRADRTGRGTGPPDLITWRDYEALRNEMRREFRIEDDGLRGEVQEINQKLDATNETVTAMADQMTDIQRSLQALQLAVENLTNQ
ncbi:hypothetical protein QYE76_029592 [Lolium multiflorum]|uniref:Uncharacterized protein n=1 Tax=Lolium multiflorum TaxID=4521 RepID=A0AAD8QPV5_LOLMU|nr:hypothetical protein QYE76_029592 [Lolium multiflorum]